VQPPDILPPKRAPTKDPPFRPDSKTKAHVLVKFPAVQQEDVDCVFKKTKKLVKLGGIVKSVVFLYILGNVIRGTTLSKCTNSSPEGIYRF
jgi:hypothetical protein